MELNRLTRRRKEQGWMESERFADKFWQRITLLSQLVIYPLCLVATAALGSSALL